MDKMLHLVHHWNKLINYGFELIQNSTPQLPLICLLWSVDGECFGENVLCYNAVQLYRSEQIAVHEQFMIIQVTPHINGLMQERSNSIANALELLTSFLH